MTHFTPRPRSHFCPHCHHYFNPHAIIPYACPICDTPIYLSRDGTIHQIPPRIIKDVDLPNAV